MTTNLPSTISAVILQEDTISVKLTQIPLTKVTQSDQILINIYSPAQNPTDPDAITAGLILPGRILGNDLAGKIVEVGRDIKKC